LSAVGDAKVERLPVLLRRARRLGQDPYDASTAELGFEQMRSGSGHRLHERDDGSLLT
jgi:hypothetical protein